MNLILEQKIKDLMDEAERQGSAATCVVLHMLLGSLHSGTHNQFAKHCCRFSGIQLQVSPNVFDDSNYIADEPERNTYYH